MDEAEFAAQQLRDGIDRAWHALTQHRDRLVGFRSAGAGSEEAGDAAIAQGEGTTDYR